MTPRSGGRGNPSPVVSGDTATGIPASAIPRPPNEYRPMSRCAPPTPPLRLMASSGEGRDVDEIRRDDESGSGAASGRGAPAHLDADDQRGHRGRTRSARGSPRDDRRS